MHRSYLFAPGHNEKLLGRVFDAGADAVMLDLEDAVPPHANLGGISVIVKYSNIVSLTLPSRAPRTRITNR